MAKYTILVTITCASGWQQFEIEADDEKEARAKFNNGDGELVHEEIQVEGFEIDSISLYEEQ